MLKVNTNSIALEDDILILSATLWGLCKKLYQIACVIFYSIFIFSTKNKNTHKKLMMFHNDKVVDVKNNYSPA